MQRLYLELCIFVFRFISYLNIKFIFAFIILTAGAGYQSGILNPVKKWSVLTTPEENTISLANRGFS